MPRAISLNLPALILTQSVLHGEPINARQLLNILVAHSQTREAHLLRERREIRVRKQRDMSEKFMAHIGFRREQRLARMPYILRGMEDPEREAVQKVAWTQQAHDRPEREAGAFLEEARGVLDLRDAVAGVAAVGHEQGHGVLVRGAGVERPERLELVPDRGPGGVFDRCVGDVRKVHATLRARSVLVVRGCGYVSRW